MMRSAIRVIILTVTMLVCLFPVPAAATEPGAAPAKLFCFQGVVVEQSSGNFSKIYVASTATGGQLIYTVMVETGCGRVDNVYYGSSVSVCGERGNALNQQLVTLNKPNHYIINMDRKSPAGTGQTQPPSGGTESDNGTGNSGTGKGNSRDLPASYQTPWCICKNVMDGYEDAPKLALLRSFRDNCLKRSRAGNDLIDCYYNAVSPVLVELAGRSEIARHSIRWLCLEPAVAVVRVSSGLWDSGNSPGI